MFLKVVFSDGLRMKILIRLRDLIFGKQGGIHYIGGTEVLPSPLSAEREQEEILRLGTSDEAEARTILIEHNLRLVVYIAKKFDNTGVGVEDMISIGNIMANDIVMLHRIHFKGQRNIGIFYQQI